MSRRLTLSRAFAARWDAWVRQLAATKERPSSRHVHELRVTSRRLLALMAALDALEPGARRSRTTLADLVDGALHDTSPLRDAHVQRSLVARAKGPGPGLTALTRHLNDRKSRQVHRVRRRLRRLDVRAATRAAARVRRALSARQIDARQQSEGLRRATGDQARVVVRRIGRIDLARPRTMHRARLDLKRLRYLIETAQQLSPVLKFPPLGPLKALQTRMGEVHDLDLLLGRLETHTPHPASHAGGVAALARDLVGRRARLTATVMHAAPRLERRLTPLTR